MIIKNILKQNLFVLLMLASLGLSTNLIAQNKNHPTFKLLDTEKKPVKDINSRVSYPETCGACHDYQYIGGFSYHLFPILNMSCVDCHIEDVNKFEKSCISDQINGKIGERTASMIILPTNEKCQICHGMSHQKTKALVYNNESIKNIEKYHLNHLGVAQGTIYPAQNTDLSRLQINNRNSSDTFDVHAQRGLECISCHYIENSLRMINSNKTMFGKFKGFVQKIMKKSGYFYKPNHDLKGFSCDKCHNVEKSHQFLPFAKRHLDIVSCEACHIPQVKESIAKTVIESFPNRDGKSIVEFWNNKSTAFNEESLNPLITSDFKPFLLKSFGKIVPYNTIVKENWYSKRFGAKIASSVLSKFYKIEVGDLSGYIFNNNQLTSEYLALFDKNSDGIITVKEAVWDEPKKKEFIKSVLKQNGVINPELIRESIAVPLHHGVLESKRATKNCNACHGSDSTIKPVMFQSPREIF